jgi:predicted lactoylglutathione lyase
MHQQIVFNLAVKDLARPRAFFESLGYRFDPAFSNDKGACLVLGEHLHAMLLTEPFFQGFTDKTPCETTRSTEGRLGLSCESRAEVDALVGKAVAAGDRAPRAPQDHGFMDGHAFEDLDGPTSELVHPLLPTSDPAAAQGAQG